MTQPVWVLIQGNPIDPEVVGVNGQGLQLEAVGAEAVNIPSTTQATTAGAAPYLAYVPGTPADWVSPVPTSVQEALDRMAANIPAVTPIP